MIIPNRHRLPIDPVEVLAEDFRIGLIEAARATGNWHLVHVMQAISEERRAAAREKKRGSSAMLKR